MTVKGIYMSNKLPQLKEALLPNSANPIEAINYINSYIKKHHCESMSVDISFMNVLDACHVSTLCSTTHYIKYPKGKINWLVSSKKVQELNKDFDLGNTIYNA